MSPVLFPGNCLLKPMHTIDYRKSIAGKTIGPLRPATKGRSQKTGNKGVCCGTRLSRDSAGGLCRGGTDSRMLLMEPRRRKVAIQRQERASPETSSEAQVYKNWPKFHGKPTKDAARKCERSSGRDARRQSWPETQAAAGGAPPLVIPTRGSSSS